MKKHLRKNGLVLLVIGAVLIGLQSNAQAADGNTVLLTDVSAGVLRHQLEALSPAALSNALKKLSQLGVYQNDIDSLRATSQGGVFYVCDIRSSLDASSNSPAVVTSHSFSFSAAAEVSVTSPPIYHSNPGATNVLFVDFGGGPISNTIWNSVMSVDVFQCLPFDEDGNTNTFSEREQFFIKEMWQRIAEDYAPFNIDVTTERPAVWNSRTGHAMMTPWLDALGQSCPHHGAGGVSWGGNAFGDPAYSHDATNCYSPVWIYPVARGPDSYSKTAEAASHEFGHDLGLSHQGQFTNAYYWGHAAGNISWAPIMGVSYNGNVTQWSKGEYYQANNTQDELAVISGKLGYRPDDTGDTDATARPMSVTGATALASGIIERTGDVDVYSFTTGAGLIQFGANPFHLTNGTWGGNADLVLELFDTNGVMLASNNPPASVSASISRTVAAGKYYLHVLPTGVDTPLASNPSGYTVYGSLGQYALTGTVVYVEPPPPPLALPFSETFETSPTNMAGTPGAVNGQHGWISDSTGNVVTTNKSSGGSQSLAISAGSVSHVFSDATGTVQISYWAIPCMGESVSAVPTNASAVFWFGTNGQVMAYSNSSLIQVSGFNLPASNWIRFDITCDYTAHAWSLSVNGTNVLQNFGFYSNRSSFSSISILQSAIINAYVDDLNISNAVTGASGDSDGDGLPDDWEILHYGNITTVAGTNLAANGINTVLEAYIAGLNPADSASVFKVLDQKLQPAGRVLTWDATNGRLYSVYFTTNLLTPDLWPLISETAGGSITDTTHGADNQGFYRIKVRIAP